MLHNTHLGRCTALHMCASRAPGGSRSRRGFCWGFCGGAGVVHKNGESISPTQGATQFVDGESISKWLLDLCLLRVPSLGEIKVGAFGARGPSGAHGFLSLVPLATTCWLQAPWGGRGGYPASLDRRIQPPFGAQWAFHKDIPPLAKGLKIAEMLHRQADCTRAIAPQTEPSGFGSAYYAPQGKGN